MNDVNFYYNQALLDATDIIVKRMKEITNRPIGVPAPNPVYEMADLIGQILARRINQKTS